MCGNDSNSSRFTHSRSPPRFLPNGRYPPRNTARYDPYTSHRRGTPPAFDGYWESRETRRPRLLNDETYVRKRYSPPCYDSTPSHRYTMPLRHDGSLTPNNRTDNSNSNISNTHETHASRYGQDHRHQADDYRWEYDRRNHDRLSCHTHDSGSDHDCRGGSSRSFSTDWHHSPGVSNWRETGRSRETSIQSATGPARLNNDTDERMVNANSQKSVQSGDVPITMDMDHSGSNLHFNGTQTNKETLRADASKSNDLSGDPMAYDKKAPLDGPLSSSYTVASEVSPVIPINHTTTSASIDISRPRSYSSAALKFKTELSSPPSLLKYHGSTQRSRPNLMDDSKENTAPRIDTKIPREPSEQEIVSRIDEIENDITKYEEMLYQLNKCEAEGIQQLEAESPSDAKDGDTDEESPKDQDLHQMTDQKEEPLLDLQHLPPTTRKPPQALMNQIRTSNSIDETLYEQIISVNQHLAKKNSCMKSGWQGKMEDDWYDPTKWTASLYVRLEDYPCYKKNLMIFDKLKRSMSFYLANRERRLQQKERRLRREFIDIYTRWKTKNKGLNRTRELDRYDKKTRGVDAEEYIDGIMFKGNHDALRFGGGDTGVSSQTKLVGINRSLEIQYPENRAAKSTATIPHMILDSKARARVYDDCSGLIEDPLTYYHTGADTDDVWTQQEMTAFMESYMRYPKKFKKVAEAVGTKTASQCVLFYYRKKTKIDFKALMRKRKRGKNKKKDQLAAAIKRAATTSTHRSKGSALLADIGQARVTKQEKQGKSKEQRELEADNAYWEGVAERRKAKRLISGAASGNSGSDLKRRVSRRKNTSSSALPDSGLVLTDSLVKYAPSSPNQSTVPNASIHCISSTTDNADQPIINTTTKWTDHEKCTAANAFRLFGRDFITVAEKVGSKTDDQCRNFYFNHKRKYGPVFGEDDGHPGLTTSLVDLHHMKINSEHIIPSSPPNITHAADDRVYQWKQISQGQRRTNSSKAESADDDTNTPKAGYLNSTGTVSRVHSPYIIGPPLESPYGRINHPPRLDPLGRDILNPSPTAIRVSDLLNPSNEPVNQNSWESWFGP